MDAASAKNAPEGEKGYNSAIGSHGPAPAKPLQPGASEGNPHGFGPAAPTRSRCGSARGHEGKALTVAYEPKLPEGVSLPPGFKVDTGDARYKALEELATRERWSQKAFSDLLGIEGRKVAADHAARAAAPTQAPAPAAKPGVPESWSKMTTQERLHWSLGAKRG